MTTNPSAPPENWSSTREVLLTIIDDIELIAREILEQLIPSGSKSSTPGTQKQSALTLEDFKELTALLLVKDDELKAAFKVAEKQCEVEKKIEAVKEEVKVQDEALNQLRKQLKEAESLLSASIYHAKKRIAVASKASSNPVSSEDLIKYSHKISASNAVCAPLNWEQGDPRRPYPTDIEMRLGLVGKTSEAIERMHTLGHSRALPQGNATPQNQVVAPGPSSASSTPGDFHPHSMHSPYNQPSPSKAIQPSIPSFAWQNEYGGGGTPTRFNNDTTIKVSEEVETMSTDSSSSSSSDSN